MPDRISFQAVVFDMDGVLVDTEPAFFDAVNDVIEGEGHHIEWERYRRFLGTSAEDTWRGVISLLGLRGEPRDYLRPYREALIDALSTPRPPLPGVLELLNELDRRGVPYGLATSSWRRWADIILRSAGLDGRFRVLVTAGDVEREKPAPDLYLRAAELLAVEPARCIAVEDTRPGVASAKRAGMLAVQLRLATTALPPIDEADLVLDTLQSFPMEMLVAHHV